MRRITFILLFLLAATFTSIAQTFQFDMTQPQPTYTDTLGYGYDIIPAPTKQSISPFYFSVKVPDGNYRVTVEIGSKKRVAHTMIRAESRRLLMDEVQTKKNEFYTYRFVVNKRSPIINDSLSIKLHDREHVFLNWDDRLTLEFTGTAPAVKSIQIEPAHEVPTLFLCGNSTVVDQEYEPYTSWGQMVTRWFNDHIAIANFAESGLTAGSFIKQNRLAKVLSLIKKGDYVLCEFGHNDQKEHAAGDGAWYNFAHNLKIFIDKVRATGATILFATPTQRRNFDKNGHIIETHDDYPQVMTAIAMRENIPLIDLHQMTREFFEALGVENSKRSLVHYPANTYPNQPKELADNTHFNPYGAYEVAKMVIAELKRLNLSLIEYIRPDYIDYNPTHPDDFQTYQWYPSIIVDPVKPAGD